MESFRGIVASVCRLMQVEPKSYGPHVYDIESQPSEWPSIKAAQHLCFKKIVLLAFVKLACARTLLLGT